MIDLSQLNDPQREAVLTTEGPLLVLAGAGSGKTRVLTHRIAHLIADRGVEPYQILAITFTNKAAGEMRARLARQIGETARGLWVFTFHAMCVRILRVHAEALGYTQSFSIYDADDSKRLIKEIMRQLMIDEKTWTPNAMAGRISGAKNEFMTPAEFAKQATTPSDKTAARIYERYQARLKAANAMDFDDLLFNTVVLFRTRKDILEQYQERFAYIHVDEYQDTNHAQYLITTMLAARSRNLMVVGDDDQSIYSWRGADLRNILDFEKEYPEAHTVKLEQNYRSTQNILEAANAVVSHNKGRKPKKLFTDKPGGEKIKLYLATSEKDEAAYVAGEIERLVAKGERLYSDCAVFYRTNAQSRNFEDAFLRAGIPYRLVGGTKFFERAEIRDVMAYLKLVVNPADDVACRRIINVPRRSIGATTVERIATHAYDNDIAFEAAIPLAVADGSLRPAAAKALNGFVALLATMRSYEGTLTDVVEMIIDKTDLVRTFELQKTDEGQARAENIKEFLSVVADYAETHDDEENTLPAFMEWLALRTDLDAVSDSEDSVTLMTVHTAKGLEYPVVFVGGLEEEIFPHANSLFSSTGIEEERRLMYVAVTRARELLYLTRASSRMTFGSTAYNPASRFISEIPEELIDASGVGSSDYSGSGHDKRGDRHGVSLHGTGRYRGSGGYGDFDPTREKDLGRVFGSSKSRARAATSRPKDTAFTAGDRIDHKTFGQGTVVRVDGDSITIDFDGPVGTKKLLVGYAPLVKISS